MAEAEDVLIEAASHATHWVRGLWERKRAGAGAAQRRLQSWQHAWLGRSWLVVPADPPATPGLVSRALRRPPPWRVRPRPAASTDGVRIFLPREWLSGPGAESARDLGLCATLALARRLAAGSATRSASGPAADIRWMVDGALGDAALVRDFPGLEAALESLRRDALAARPDLHRLLPAEREVEEIVRSLLEARCSDPPLDLGAQWTAGGAGYRGVAPVAHWGEPGAAGSPERRRAGRGKQAGSRGGPPPSATLPGPMQETPAPPEPERPGPFVIPFGDGHLGADEPGVVRPRDAAGDEDPEVLAAELARLGRLPRVHDDGAVREVLEGGSSAPGRASGEDPRPSGPVYVYPEWDSARGHYRVPGSWLRELPPDANDAAFAERVMVERRTLHRRLRRQLEELRPRRQRLRGQLDGDELDLGAWVADWADFRAGHAPSGRVYSHEQHRRRDVAVTLLLDASGSTESPIGSAGRVIDVVKEAALAFSIALTGAGDRHAVLAFSGQGAGGVRVRRLKRFDESAGSEVRGRIGGLQPDAFTRLGAALRHASAGLSRQPARSRLLLVLSDGKPQDDDHYQGDYGIEDTRQAVAEARSCGVRVFCVAIDHEAADSLPRMFGPHGYTVLMDPATLPERLAGIYRRLTRAA